MDSRYFDRDTTKLKTTPFGIFTDQAGYFPAMSKKAVIPFECDSFEVTDINGKVCFSGKTTHFGMDEHSGDDVYIADLTDFCEKGSYRVNAGGKTSAVFTISDDVYSPVLHDTLKAFYYLRCGCELDERYAGVYKHGKCHTGKAVLWDDNSVAVDACGGWHDAGDYGRYVTAGACAAAHLLYAYKMFPRVFDRMDMDIPKGNAPDILTECRYELEWLMKMQSPDGGAYHKLTTKVHAPFIMPEDDREQLFVFPVSSMATADLAAVCALASGIYREYDGGFAEKLKNTAEKAMAWLGSHDEFIGFTNPHGCNTGGYGERDDLSNRYWAYGEMFALTGERIYEEQMKSLAERGFPLTGLGYAEMGGLGSLAHILCTFEKDTDFSHKLKDAFAHRAGYLRTLSDKCGYDVAMHIGEYCWGSNMNLLKNGMIFAIDEHLNGNDRASYAASQMHYLLGANALGISYVTGTGEFRCNYPHLRPSFADGIEECIPGMVAGGPNHIPGDPFAKEVIKPGTPPMKCYADDAASYSLNEITIYWNSPAVFLLGFLCDRYGDDGQESL